MLVSTFLSTLSLRRATLAKRIHPFQNDISIHALLAESDLHRLLWYKRSRHFYPRSPCGERLELLGGFDCRKAFLSTLSLRRATNLFGRTVTAENYFYPRSPCGERLLSDRLFNGTTYISIQALLAESDLSVHGIVRRVGISIHALLAESDKSIRNFSPS